MKTKAIILLSLGIIFTTLSGCQEEDSITSPNKIKIDEADLAVINLVKNFESFGSATKTLDKEIEITSYQKTTYTIPIISKENSINAISSTNEEIPDSTTVDVYLVNFIRNEESAWSIATSDERLSRVYAYSERGQISDTSFIPPLADIVRNIPDIVKEDINKYYTEPKTKATGTYKSVGPLLKTAWSQWGPYNRYVPFDCDDPNNSTKKAPLGCVATAASQAIAYYNKFKPTYYGNNNLNLPALASMSSPNTEDLKNQAATFCHEVAMYCQIEFGCKGSGSQIHDAAQYMGEMGYNYEFEDNAPINKMINAYKAYQCFSKGDLVMTSGNKSVGSGGHAWLYDGIRGYLNGTSFELESLHCNWGQGYPEGSAAWDNGWYVNYRKPDPKENPYTSYNDNVYMHVK